jgi:recombination protein RecR
MQFSSKLIEEAVNEVSKLPGIGKKTALRLVLHLLKQDESETQSLAESLQNVRLKINYCKKCHNISDEEVCTICQAQSRDHSTICVVEDTQDVMAIENTNQYHGLYHVLGGVISPVRGIGPSEIKMESLVHRVAGGTVKEVIVALSATMEGDTTSFYITKRLKDFPVRLSGIARGIPVGNELEHTDEVTLGRSIISRTSISH